MHDEPLDSEPSVNEADFDIFHEDDQFEIYLQEVVKDLLLLNLWDVCHVYAGHIAYSGKIPGGIKGVDLDLLNEAIEDDCVDVPELLNPIQKWLSEELINSINNNEIKPKIIGRFLDGKIDAKRTYIDDGEIESWLLCRNVNIEVNSEGFYEYSSSIFDRIFNEIIWCSRFLSAKVYNIYLNNQEIGFRKIEDVLSENELLKVQLQKASSRPKYKKMHGNTERFAKRREEVLGAALSVIVQWPEMCKNASGKFEATKIAKLIDQKSALFWTETGEPPLGIEKMEREISKWINSTGK